MSLALLVLAAKQVEMSSQVEAFLSQCFEEEEEFEAVMADAARVQQLIAQEREVGQGDGLPVGGQA